MAGGSGIAIGVGGTIGGAVGSAFVGVGAPIVLLGVAYLGLRAIFARKSRTRIRVVSDLMDKLVAELTHAAG